MLSSSPATAKTAMCFTSRIFPEQCDCCGARSESTRVCQELTLASADLTIGRFTVSEVPKIDLEAATEAIEAFLRAVGAPIDSDPELRRTGASVAKAFSQELLSGYRSDLGEIFASATESRANGLIAILDLPTTLMCPHHLLPSPGVTHVVYLPGKTVVGFGVVAKLAEHFSRRLALQEDYAQNVASAMVEYAQAEACLCVANLNPLCLTARSPHSTGARSVTKAFAGPSSANPGFRREALECVAETR